MALNDYDVEILIKYFSNEKMVVLFLKVFLKKRKRKKSSSVFLNMVSLEIFNVKLLKKIIYGRKNIINKMKYNYKHTFLFRTFEMEDDLM